MKVLVVAEFYPRADDPVLGVWAHRQALATRDAGAQVEVLVLQRIVPPAATPRGDRDSAALTLARHPRRLELDGLRVTYVPFASPPRWRSYGSWGAWAAPPLAAALGLARRRFAYDLVHAHNAVPAADALLRARERAPLVVSEHGADVFHTAVRHDAGRTATRRAFTHARLVLANSEGIAQAAREMGAARTRVVHLGTDLPGPSEHPHAALTLTTVAHLVERKRHADVLQAIALLGDRIPTLRYDVIGDGPERPALERLAGELGIAARVRFHGQLDHADALREARRAAIFVMPSVEEAFGVAYVEAMAGWLPAIGALDEPGPQEIAAAGVGLRRVPARDPQALAEEIAALAGDPAELAALGRAARATVERAFTWEGCGAATVAAYAEALRG